MWATEQVFLEGLLKSFVEDASKGCEPTRAVLLAAAAVELLHAQPLLAEHAAALGYVSPLLKVVAATHASPQGILSASQGKRACASSYACRNL